VVEEGDFSLFYTRHLQNVFRATLLLSGDRNVAEDATQEAFAKALERWNRLAVETWAVGWVMTTALNEARRMSKRRWFAPSLGVRPAAEEFTGVGAELAEALRKLPRRQQEAVCLVYVADLSLGDAARLMGCETGTVKSHLARARDRMARLLQTEDR
jgi:RNA polymerase sigma factor (sigma-70 family)